MTTETNNELPKVEYEYEEWRRAVLRASARQALETLRREFAEADHDSAQQQPSEEGDRRD